MLSVLCLLTLFVPLCESLAKDNLSTGKAKHLYVQRTKPLRGSSSPIEVIYLNDDVSGSSEPSLERAHGSRSTQSQKHARRKRSVTGQPEVTKYLFNDTHNMLYVHWSGFNFSDTVVVLSRDIYPSSGSTSYLYVSNDYGKHYANDSKKLKYTAKDGTKKVGLIETFYNSPIHKRRYIFADTTNNVLFISKDDCKTLEAALLDFKPSEISFHSSKGEGLLAYDEDTEKLYYSNDFGFHWSSREDNVKSYFWGFEDVDNDDVVYLEIGNGNGSDIVRGHYAYKRWVKQYVKKNVQDFEIMNVYLFVTRKSKNGLDLYVGQHGKDISLAEFPNELKRQDYFIADASEKQVFVAVNHNANTTHLYISDVSGKKYSLSLERVLYYNPDQRKDSWLRRYMKYTFIDLYRVESMRGVYLASQLSRGKVGTRAIYTVITYDKGAYWNKLDAPTVHADGRLVNCSIWDSCSLHLAQHFARLHPRYYAPSVMSRKSAPGLIVSSGNIGERLSYSANLYVSNDAGETWLEVLRGRWYFNFGDHGGIIVTVRQWSPTKELLYSTDEGLTWKTYTFSSTKIRVYGLLTEPGEKTTIFTVFGSYVGAHHWLVVQVDVRKVLGRFCTDSDYVLWTPYSRGVMHQCILGQKLRFERRNRTTTCYNGRNYDRAIDFRICRCTWADFECDAGFLRYWGNFCWRDSKAGFNPYAPPRPCPPGTLYNKTQGYIKIAGDKCHGGYEFYLQPFVTTCPFYLDKAFLLYAERDSIQYVDLRNISRKVKIRGLSGAVSLAYDIKEGYIYWADMIDHQIFRAMLNGSDKAIPIAGIKQVEGMDFDWTTDNLYWVDSVEKVIEVCRKDGLFRRTVHSDDLDKPRALALDPHKGEMFWSDWGETAKIEMSDMDGKNRVVLVNSEIQWPNGLAIDIYSPNKTRQLFWTDARLDKIESYDLLTKKRKVIADRSMTKFKTILLHPYSIAVDDTNIYWDDWSSNAVYAFHKSRKGGPHTLIPGQRSSWRDRSRRKFEVKVYYGRSQKDRSSCSSVSCSQLCLPKPKNKYVCACADDLVKDPKTGDCKCTGGLVTLVNGTCFRPHGKKCGTDEFTCLNSDRCVNKELICDYQNDCGDWSDELGCSHSNKCNPTTEFRCPDGACIPIAWRCDGESDCLYNSDEWNCYGKKCRDNEFACRNNSRCLSRKLQCDHKNDCGDWSDELGCSDLARCNATTEFRCPIGLCISSRRRCDGYPDCPSHADELLCSRIRCESYEFRCRNGKCIDVNERCNSRDDCGDHSDELSCRKPHVDCPAETHFFCDDKKKCIDIAQRCNNHTACSDNSDEIDCVRSCRADAYFMCEDHSKCIPIAMKCDGHKDCVYDDSDEFCGSCNVTTEFRCSDGSCIPITRLCDGKRDCYLGTDERNCVLECPAQTHFLCKDQSACLDKPLRCNNYANCPDGSDEINCARGHSGGASAARTTDSKKKTLIWAIPVGIVVAMLLGALAFFVVKSRKLQRNLYRLVRSDSDDHGVTYHNGGDDDDMPLIQGFSDDDPMVEA